jgi:hypothetical protein
MTLLRAVLIVVFGAACSGRSADDRAQPAAAPAEVTRPAAPAAPTAPTGSAGSTNAGAAAADVAGVPRGCDDYAELIKKLASCDRLGAARDGLAQAYRDLVAAWSAVPADQRAQLEAQIEAQCKTQADSLRNAAAATCGW